MDENPVLTEPGVSHLLKSALKEYHNVKESNISLIFNIVTTIILFLILGGILSWRYKGKLTKSEIYEKNRIKQEYIVSKLQQYSGIRKKTSLITDLPTWEEHPEFNRLAQR